MSMVKYKWCFKHSFPMTYLEGSECIECKNNPSRRDS